MYIPLYANYLLSKIDSLPYSQTQYTPYVISKNIAYIYNFVDLNPASKISGSWLISNIVTLHVSHSSSSKKSKIFSKLLTFILFYYKIYLVRRCSSMVEHQPSKLNTWVRFPSPAFFVSKNRFFYIIFFYIIFFILFFALPKCPFSFTS